MPPTPQSPRPTDAELEILRVLWSLGPCTVRQVHDELSPKRDVGYTTMLKLMQIMTDKGLLLRNESQRSHVYRARQKETVTQKQLVKDLVSRAFGGATEKLVMQALSSKKATAQEIADIRKLLDEMEGGVQ
jgi:BlaI family transcriptional regulator, penicillinase repressor